MVASQEAPKPNGEKRPIDPVQDARNAFNKALFSPEPSGPAILGLTVQYENALYGSALPKERIFHELTVVAGQAADRVAELDASTSEILRGMQHRFEMTFENVSQQPSVVTEKKPVEPTKTESLPMTGAKGTQGKQEKKPEAKTEPIQARTPESDPTQATVASKESEDKPDTPAAQPSSQTPRRRGRPPKVQQ
jgi:hypothetical protein